MKSTLKKIAALLAVGTALLAWNTTRANEIDYSNVTGASINFNGNSTFNFATTDLSGNMFRITTVGPAQNLLGSIGGTFTIGTVTTVGGLSTAPVSGSGLLTIHDGLSNDLTGTVSWLDMQQAGTGDSLNINGQLNLTNITYSGLNTTLLQIANSHSANDTLSFQFSSAVTLAQLKTTVQATSFSGSISAPDGGTTVMLLGFALSGLALMRRRRTA
jgi:hypothetical protein